MTIQFLPRPLPESLETLTELALDTRWTWSHAGDAVWRSLDRELWERTRNPWAILQNVPESRLDALAADAGFRKALADLAEDRRRYLAEPGSCARVCGEACLGSVAYFCMEFGLSEAFPLYAGGLGVLAGDCLKTASDLGVPLVGVGLLYQEGYFRQVVDARGAQLETYPYNDPTSLPIQPVIGPSGAWLRVDVEFPGRTVHLRVWQATVGRARLYLLDSNSLMNGPVDRGITAKLYGDAAETRLMQEIVLGIGGWRMLEALGIAPEVCHLNEGHAAFAVLERARALMAGTGVSFDEALWATRAGNVFTTHTPVAAGFDRFDPGLMRRYFREPVREMGIGLPKLLGLGRADPRDEAEPFNMAYLALRGCAQANGVSRLHGAVSRRLFEGLYPGWPEREVPVGHVTNGVHVPSWDSAEADELWSRACGKRRWLGPLGTLPAAMEAVSDEALWELAARRRAELVRLARRRLSWQLAQRGADPARVEAVSHALDPNVLTLGFARRFAEYKRPDLLLHDEERLARLVLDARRPVQLVIAGKAHPLDEEGKRRIQAWLAFVNRPEMRMHAVFLEDYDLALAQELVQGVDVWINTPRRPWEACGTSGMKVLANGGLNVSTLDGWWAEAYAPEVGWVVGDARDGLPGEDAQDAERLYRVLESEVIPGFYERDALGVPRAWIRRMRASISTLAPRFSSNRMLREYLERYYCGASSAYRRRTEAGAKLARELHAWQGALASNWSEIHFGEVRATRQGGDWLFEVTVHLGEIAADSVKVELCADPVAGGEAVREAMERGAALAGVANGYVYSACASASRPEWHYTPRVVAFHPEAFTPAECALVSWQR